ncbi:hypothetical protein [Undibacterium sp.]|uniref:hypothetical protein n=1 Tax=Undibacterium sp. TaxID=1914977 RepID=UPI002BDF1304|nr:hypothetical protein [Undibacterium sp.]HTD02595.1 hypothetical protein [Undibacterium sp.]
MMTLLPAPINFPAAAALIRFTSDSLHSLGQTFLEIFASSPSKARSILRVLWKANSHGKLNSGRESHDIAKGPGAATTWHDDTVNEIDQKICRGLLNAAAEEKKENL